MCLLLLLLLLLWLAVIWKGLQVTLCVWHLLHDTQHMCTIAQHRAQRRNLRPHDNVDESSSSSSSN